MRHALLMSQSQSHAKTPYSFTFANNADIG